MHNKGTKVEGFVFYIDDVFLQPCSCYYDYNMNLIAGQYLSTVWVQKPRSISTRACFLIGGKEKEMILSKGSSHADRSAKHYFVYSV